MTKITLILLILTFTIGTAQPPDWKWAHNYAAANNDMRGLTTIDNAGNVYLTGFYRSGSIAIGSTTYINSGVGNTGNFYVIKHDSNGNILWSRHEGGDNFDDVRGITADQQGNVYITGKFYNQITFGNTTLNAPNVNGVYLVKYDTNGNVVWAKKAYGTLSNVEPFKLKADIFGNLYTTGIFYGATVTVGETVLTNNNFGEQSTGGAVLIAKFDTDGNVLWGKCSQQTGSTPFPNWAFEVEPDNAGNVYIGGAFFTATIDFGGVVLTKAGSGDNNIFMVKYDGQGNALWAKAPTAVNPNSFVHAISTDNSNNVYFSGTYSGTVTFNDVILSSTTQQLFTVKYDSSGNFNWIKTAATGYGTIDSSDVDEEGNLYVAGSFFGDSINFGNGPIATSSDSSLFVTKYAADGNAQWTKLAQPFNINNRISLDCMTKDNLVIAGIFFAPTLNFGPFTLNRTATPDDCNLFVAKLAPTELSTPNFAGNLFSMYPNPVKETAYINNLKGENKFTLYDFSGKTVRSGLWHNETETIDAANLSMGVYLLKVQSESGETATQKLIKE